MVSPSAMCGGVARGGSRSAPVIGRMVAFAGNYAAARVRVAATPSAADNATVTVAVASQRMYMSCPGNGYEALAEAAQRSATKRTPGQGFEQTPDGGLRSGKLLWANSIRAC